MVPEKPGDTNEKVNETIDTDDSAEINFVLDRNKLETSRINFNPNEHLALFHAGKGTAGYVYNACSLEGNTHTLPEIMSLLSGITVGGHKVEEQQQILRQYKAFKKILSLVKDDQFRLNKGGICELNFIVAQDEALEWGVFRSGQVRIGGTTNYEPPRAEELDDIFADGLSALKREEDCFIRAFCYFMFGSINQFFYDGNKRTSKLVMNAILLQNGFPLLDIEKKDENEYNEKLINFYETQEGTDFLNYLINYYYMKNKDLGFR